MAEARTGCRLKSCTPPSATPSKGSQKPAPPESGVGRVKLRRCLSAHGQGSFPPETSVRRSDLVREEPPADQSSCGSSQKAFSTELIDCVLPLLTRLGSDRAVGLEPRIPRRHRLVQAREI